MKRMINKANNKLVMGMLKLQNGGAAVQDRLTATRRGSGTLEYLIIALMVVIVGAALLAVVRVAFPELFNDMINKIKETFTL